MSTTLKFTYGSSVLQFEYGSSYPSRRVNKLYQVKDRTAAGTPQTENLGITTIFKTFVFDALPQTDYDNLVYFFESVVFGSTYQFEIVDEYNGTFNAYFDQSELDFQEVDYQVYSGSFVLELST